MGFYELDTKTYPVIGIDLSHWSLDVDFKKFKEHGGTFAVIKALDGKALDSYFVRNYKAAKDAGIFVSSYQWLYSEPIVSPGGQARAFLDLLKDYPVDFAPCIDYEQTKSGNPTEKDLYGWAYPFEQGYGSKPIIYSSNGYLNDPRYDLGSYFKDFPLWIAQYGVLNPEIPKPFSKWLFWQVTPNADGVYYGAKELGVDANYFNGSMSEFLKLCGKDVSQPDPKPEEPPVVINEPVVEVTGDKYKCSATAGLNVRPLPSTFQSPIGVLNFGEIVDEVSNNSDGSWKQIKRSNGTVGWCYSQYLQCVLVTTPETPSNETEGYWFALHDWQIPPDYKIRKIPSRLNGIPEVFRTGEIDNSNNGSYSKLDEKWQWFWLELCSKHIFNRYTRNLTKSEFSWIAKELEQLGGNTKAFMNGHGLNTCRYYPTKKRMGKELPALYSLICGGMSGRGVVVRNKRGVEMVKLESFDGTKPPPPFESIDIYKDPRIFFATNIGKRKVSGGYSVTKFPTFSDPLRGIYRDSLVIFVSNMPVYYPKDHMIWVSGSTKRSPYFPES